MNSPDTHDLLLKSAAPSDGAWLYELYRSTMRSVIDEALGWREREQRERFNKSYAIKHFELIVQNETRVGTLYRTRRPESLHLSLLLVAPPFQNKGIGTTMVRELQAGAAGKITLSVLENNPALGLYQRLGFVVEEEDPPFFILAWSPSP